MFIFTLTLSTICISFTALLIVTDMCSQKKKDVRWNFPRSGSMDYYSLLRKHTLRGGNLTN